MAKNISDKYKGIGETGKAINDIKERTVTGELMEQIYKNFSVNPKTGKLEVKKDASEVSGITSSELNLSTGKGNIEKLYDKDGNPTKELLDNVASIKAFQKAMGLKPDGKIGPKTLKAMGLEK